MKVKQVSIYDIKHEKDQHLQLKNDSSSMGFAVFLKEKDLGFDLTDNQRSDVFMNSLFVHLIQMFMIYAIWKYAKTNKDFIIIPPIQLDMSIARFLASMFMHINVEKDVKHGINMMKTVRTTISIFFRFNSYS